ncbi:methyltransferase domain-containing protein, partial [Patescibacteria group bacterium]
GRSKNKAELCRHTNLKISFKRMFERGQTIPVLKENYPNLSQISIKNKIQTYWKKRKILMSHPIYTIGLFILKIVDLFGFTFGYIFPRQVYFLKSVAKSYESKRMSTNFTLYKHFVECYSLKDMILKRGKIIEIGSGTGRITKEFVDKGFNIISTDPSSTMLKEFSKKKNLPKPVLAFGDKLPFKAKSFNSSFAIRVIWHHPRSKSLAIIKEMVRVSSSFVIFDVVNNKRLFKFFITPNTYPVNLKTFIKICKKECGIKIEKIIPMDVTLPIWLNLFPKKFAKNIYSPLYKLDLKLARIMPPGRYLLKFKIVKN